MRSGALLQKLRQHGCVRHSNVPFKLKSGAMSTLYVDLRLLITNPSLLRETAIAMQQVLPPFDSYDYVAGVVAGGVPLAVMLSQVTGKPMLMVRSERKAHGTGNLIEGLPSNRDNDNPLRVLLVEDVSCISKREPLTNNLAGTGGSVLETHEKIKAENLNINVVGVVAVLLRGPLLDTFTLPLYRVWSIDDLRRDSLARRGALATNSVAKKLFRNMEVKQSNLIWSADIVDGKELLHALAAVAPYIIGVKMHFDTLKDGDSFDFETFTDICLKNDLVIINDRKYADIESTVMKQVRQLQKRVLFDCATVHSVAGSGPIKALAVNDASAVIVAEMSCDGSIPLGATLALDNMTSVAGVVCQARYNGNDVGDGVVYMTPGVHLSASTDGLNQNYRSVEQAINRDGCDVIIVGRGITNPRYTFADFRDALVLAAKDYKIAGWKALTNELYV